jgi:hypothetical protein
MRRPFDGGIAMSKFIFAIALALTMVGGSLAVMTPQVAKADPPSCNKQNCQ